MFHSDPLCYALAHLLYETIHAADCAEDYTLIKRYEWLSCNFPMKGRLSIVRIASLME